MGKQLECELCGALHEDASKHRSFHEDIAAWIHLIELEVDARIRADKRRADR